MGVEKKQMIAELKEQLKIIKGTLGSIRDEIDELESLVAAQQRCMHGTSPDQECYGCVQFFEEE